MPGSGLTLARSWGLTASLLRPPWCECLPLSASEPPLNLSPATQILHHWDFPRGLCSSTQTPGRGLAVNPAHHGAKSACQLKLLHLYVGGILGSCSAVVGKTGSQTYLSHILKSDWWCWEERQDITMDAQEWPFLHSGVTVPKSGQLKLCV